MLVRRRQTIKTERVIRLNSAGIKDRVKGEGVCWMTCEDLVFILPPPSTLNSLKWRPHNLEDGCGGVVAARFSRYCKVYGISLLGTESYYLGTSKYQLVFWGAISHIQCQRIIWATE